MFFAALIPHQNNITYKCFLQRLYVTKIILHVQIVDLLAFRWPLPSTTYNTTSTDLRYIYSTALMPIVSCDSVLNNTALYKCVCFIIFIQQMLASLTVSYYISERNRICAHIFYECQQKSYVIYKI
jgi:hypothetical protein